MPENTIPAISTEFQPFLLGIPPTNKRHYGYGTWEVVCPNCGKIRTVRSHKFKGTGKVRAEVHKCQACRALGLQKRTILKCPTCGVERIVTLTNARERLSSYCTRCAKQTYGKREKRGNRHCNITSRGYVVVLGMKGHPLTKYNSVPEHWLILYEQHQMGAESVLWFRNKGFTLHHKNGKRDDNALENLELRAPGRHPRGWTIEDMEEVVRRYRGTS